MTRVEGYATLRAVSHSLNCVGLPLETFRKPDNLHVGPLAGHEERVLSQGVHWIYDARSGSVKRQLPADFNFDKIAILISISDQGPLNCPGLDYLQFKLGAMVLPLYDPFHRCWNDLKSALKASGLFKTVVQYSLVYNLNYGPNGSKTWFQRKRQYAAEFCAKSSAHQEPFLSNLPVT